VGRVGKQCQRAGQQAANRFDQCATQREQQCPKQRCLAAGRSVAMSGAMSMGDVPVPVPVPVAMVMVMVMVMFVPMIVIRRAMTMVGMA